MKILLSAATLYSALKKIDFDGVEYVVRVNLEGDKMTIITTDKVIDLYVTVLEFKASVNQENRRWDWIKKTVKNKDCPLTLIIRENCTDLIFQF